MKLLIFFLLVISLFANNEDFSLIKKETKKGDTVLFIGGIQGDEPGGFMSADMLNRHYKITYGNIWIIPNLNADSILANNRGLYGDMNRKFQKISKKDKDYKAIERLKKILLDKQINFIVHMHDGSGFYRHKYIDKLHNPHKWGQAIVIDQDRIDDVRYGILKVIATYIKYISNQHLLDKDDKFLIKNTHTKDGDKEMMKSLTYFVVKHKKPAFGIETSKKFPTYKRVYYKLIQIEAFMDVAGIKYKRDFKLTPENVKKLLYANSYIVFIKDMQDFIKLPLNNLKTNLRYFPLERLPEYIGSSPLIRIKKRGKAFSIYYGNKVMTNLYPEYLKYSHDLKNVTMIIDNKQKNIDIGSIITVKKSFEIKLQKGYRVNVIGFSKKGIKNEKDIKISYKDLIKRYAIDKDNKIFRIEFYKGKIFEGMILAKFN